MFVETVETSRAEWASVSAIEITSVPDTTILSESYPQGTDVEQEIRLSFGGMLSEIYQKYRILCGSYADSEISVEMLWLTEPAENQSYKANIRLFMIVRAIYSSKDGSAEIVNNLISIIESTCKGRQYSTEIIDGAMLKDKLKNFGATQTRAIVKEENLEFIGAPLLPQCYSFDRFCAGANDMSSILNCLTDHPNCALSVQLISTKFDNNELRSIMQTSQLLETLSHGVISQGVGNISYPSAEKLAETYRYYAQGKSNALFMYGIFIYGDATDVDEISSKIYGYLTYYPSNAPTLKTISVQSMDVKENYVFLPWIENQILLNTARNAQIWSYGDAFQSFFRLPYIITPEEASEFFRLPIGSRTSAAGIKINETVKGKKTYSEGLIDSGDIEIGTLKSSADGSKIGISLKDLAKHMLVVGTPGSGKTTFSVSLMDRLWKNHKIPFLIIEPAKTEYRALISSIPDIQVFTPGKNSISPLVINPFIPPKNVTLETYKATLKTAFSAAVSMTSPLDLIFEETINNCYSDFKWLDYYTSDDKGLPFNISDFIKCFEETFNKIGYTGDARNIGRAGTVRLKSLINLFDNYYSIPIEDILSKPTIIELAAIENSDEKALIIAIILLSVLAYVNANYIGEGGLKNVILLEEAHVLLDAKGGGSDANPSMIAQDLLKRMLAEIRSYGVGLVVADQSPRKVSEDVVALTDIKIVFRLVEAKDKQIIADSTNMSEVQSNRISRLKPGEAFFFFNKLSEPEEVSLPDYRLENNIQITISDNSLKELSTYWKSNAEKLRPYPECKYISCCSDGCDYRRRLIAKEIARRIFVKNFSVNDSNFELVEKVFGQITRLTISELNGEAFSPELFKCMKCQLWRNIKYGTKISISDILIKNSLCK